MQFRVVREVPNRKMTFKQEPKEEIREPVSIKIKITRPWALRWHMSGVS